MIPGWYKKMANPLRGEDGNVFILVGLMAFLLLMAVGVSIDMTREQILQQRMSASLDAAGLAAAETISTPPSSLCTPSSSTDVSCNQTWANQEAARFFNANFPAGYLGSNVANPSVSLPNNDLTKLALTVNGAQQPVIMQTFGFNTLNVAAASQVSRSSNGEGIELVLALDNTGSMASPIPGQSTTKIVALQNAANELLNILYGSNTTVPNLYVSVIPFSDAVNVGTNNVNLPNSAFDAVYNATLNPVWGPAPNGTWGGCVLSRSTALVDLSTGLTYDESDIPPSASASPTQFQDYLWLPAAYHSTPGGPVTFTPPITNAQCNADDSQLCNLNQWQTGSLVPPNSYNVGGPDPYGLFPLTGPFPGMGPNAYCPQALTPMQSDKTVIQSAINSMSATGDTAINIGLAWAWRMLSPRWTSLWASDPVMSANSLPLPYNTTNFIKVIVLMTDGTNFISPGGYSAYGMYNSGSLGTGYTTLPPVPPNLPGCDSADCQNAAALDLDARTLRICNALKQSDKNVIIYTIGFGLPVNDNYTPPYDLPQFSDRTDNTRIDANMLNQCAGGTVGNVTGQFFLAPTNQALADAFNQIGNAIENIRISK